MTQDQDTKTGDTAKRGRTVARGESESSLVRMLSVVELFSPEHPTWTAEQIANEMGLTQSTAYRYIAALTSFGYLAPLSGAEYGLGPKIIELDLMIRHTDPLISRAREKAEELVATVPAAVASLINLHGDTAISVLQVKKPQDLEISFERGRSMKLYAGSAAKVILAHLPRSRLLKLYGNHHADIRNYGLGETWKEFSRALLMIRKSPTLTTIGEANPNSWGIAAPVFNADGDIKGSLVVIMPRDTYETTDRDRLADRLAAAARELAAPPQKGG